jgi:hypothetical protein
MLERSADEKPWHHCLLGKTMQDASAPSSSNNVLAETASTKADFPHSLEGAVPLLDKD